MVANIECLLPFSKTLDPPLLSIEIEKTGTECKGLTCNLKQKFSVTSSAITEPITLQESKEILSWRKRSVMGIISRKKFAWFEGKGPKSRPFFIKQPNTINYNPIMICLLCFTLLKRSIEIIKKSKHHQLNTSRLH